MAELRSVDPRTLKPNPNNPRQTAAPKEMDNQLIASIKAIGIIQPPVVRTIGEDLVIKTGERRVRAAIAAGLPAIDVLVANSDDSVAPMESLSENVVRQAMGSVDIWRAIERLEKQGWTDQAIADALAQPLRTIMRLKQLARIHPPILEVMARGQMPTEEQLRTIAAASLEEQAQVWKKNKPKKGETVYWHDIARALSKRRIPFASAKFGDDLARAYGVEWIDDLFAPAGEDGRYTTNVEGFFGAQQEWLANHLPERARIVPQNQYGQPELPKKAERVYGRPTKTDTVGHYLDQHSGEVCTIVYRMPPDKKATKAAAGASNGKDGAAVETGDEASEQPQTKPRPDLTQKGMAIVGDLRTDALHQALRDSDISDQTMIGLLVLAFAGKNVSVQSGSSATHWDRQAIGNTLIEGDVLTADDTLLRNAARDMLIATLSCRDNMTNSGITARIAAEAIGASRHLPSMANEEFLSCLSRQALERSAVAAGVAIQTRVKDTRAALIAACKEKIWHFFGALFALAPDERNKERHTERGYIPGRYAEDEADGTDDVSDSGDDMDHPDVGDATPFDDAEHDGAMNDDGAQDDAVAEEVVRPARRGAGRRKPDHAIAAE